MDVRCLVTVVSMGVVACLGGTAAAAAQTGAEFSPGQKLSRIDPELERALEAEGKLDLLVSVKMPQGLSRLQFVPGREPLAARRAADVKNIAALAQMFGPPKARVMAKAHGARVVHDWAELPTQILRVESLEQLNDLAADPIVSGFYPMVESRLALSESLPLIGQPDAAAAGDVGRGSTVAVIDTGANYKVADLGKCRAPGPNCRVWANVEIAAPDGKADDSDHGTNVSSIVARVAPSSKIVALDVFTKPKGGGSATASDTDLFSALAWIVGHHNEYQIVAANMSLGQGDHHVTTCTTEKGSAEFALLRHANITPVVAAGNNAYTSEVFSEGVSWPACLPGAVVVGNVYDANVGGLTFGKIDPSTKRGDCTDAATAALKLVCSSQGGDLVDVVAPGAKITAGGITMSGTSQAAPHVAGAVAVMAAKFSMTNPTQIESALRATDHWVSDDRTGNSYPLLDMPNAIAELGSLVNDTTNHSITDGTVTLGVNELGGLIANDENLSYVGLRYEATGADAVTPGCLCEGWGLADPEAGVSAFTNMAAGTSGVFADSYTPVGGHDGVMVGTTTSIGLGVFHVFTKTSIPGIYRVDIEIHNNNATATGPLIYRRVVDWDVPPTTFEEYVTSVGSAEPGIRFVSDNGFASSDPLTGESQILASGDFTNSGPADHGALIDIEVPGLAPDAFGYITMYYGAKGTRLEAADSMSKLGVKTYVMGQPGDVEDGTPNTFILGFR